MRIVRPFSEPASSVSTERAQALLVGEQNWTREDVLQWAVQLAATWRSNETLVSAPLIAVWATPTAATVVACWTLIELGIPILPLHPAWSEHQCRQVLIETGAALLPPLDQAPAKSALGVEGNVLAGLRRPITEKSPLAVVFTSGSSARPKGVILSHRSFWETANATKHALGVGADDRWHLSLSLAHVGGLAIACRVAVLGGSVVLPATEKERSFRAEDFVERCAETKVTTASLVPTQLARVCTAQLSCPPDVRRIFLGGAPAPQPLIETAQKLGWPILRTYGLTEACSQVATDRTPRSRGPLQLLPHVEASVGEDGCLALRGDCLFSGYWGHPPQDPDSWFTTTDVAVVSADHVVISGRADEVLISGGENIHPAEVDAALAGAPGVAHACTFGRESTVWGQELCAVVVPGPDYEPFAVLAYLRGVLPSYKIPKAWLVVPELPLGATGKVSRLRCRELHGAACHPCGAPPDA